MIVFMRLVALFLVVAALLMLGADAITSLERGGDIMVRSLDTVWAIVHPASLYTFKTWVQNHAPFLAQAVYSSLALPGWAATGVVGVIVSFIFGRKVGPE